MQDTIIKGNGRSRSIRSVPNLAELAPTYEDFLKLFAGDGVPVDLGPLDPAGLERRGTDLNKGTLLADETAALYGKDASAVPDEIFAAIRPLISAAQGSSDIRARVASGSYTGEMNGGTMDKTLTFEFEPYLLIVCSSGVVAGYTFSDFLIAVRGVSNAAHVSVGNSRASGAPYAVSFSGKSVTFENMDYIDRHYSYIAVG